MIRAASATAHLAANRIGTGKMAAQTKPPVRTVNGGNLNSQNLAYLGFFRTAFAQTVNF
jgi:hypothetical protein